MINRQNRADKNIPPSLNDPQEKLGAKFFFLPINTHIFSHELVGTDSQTSASLIITQVLFYN